MPSHEPRQSEAGQYHEHRQRLVAQAVDEERVEQVADVFEEQRPAGSVQREHLAVATDVIAGTRYGGDEKQGTQQGEHNHGRGHAGAVPLLAALQHVEHHAQYGAHYNHGVQADEASLEEVAQGQRFAPTVVVGIADDEAGEDEEEIHGQVAMVDDGDEGASGGEGQSLEDVVEHHEQGCHPTQSVQDFIMRLGVHVGGGRRS